MELVLRVAEALLATCQEGQKPEILARLRDIKSQWEETVTYMTHCHRWGQSGNLTAHPQMPVTLLAHRHSILGTPE